MSDRAPIINRIAAVVEPNEPYFAWARALDDDEPSIDSLSAADLTSVYLIDEDEDAERSLRRHWEWIFEEKLYSWHRGRQDWPRKRTYKIFREWFDVRLVGLVFDLHDCASCSRRVLTGKRPIRRPRPTIRLRIVTVRADENATSHRSDDE